MDSVIPRTFTRHGRSVPSAPRRSGVLAAGASETILDLPVTAAAIIDQINLASDHISAAIELRPRTSDGGLQSRYVAHRAGTFTLLDATLNNIATHVFGEMEIVLWESVENRFGARLRQALHWPFGGQIRIVNKHTASINIAITVSYREV